MSDGGSANVADASGGSAAREALFRVVPAFDSLRSYSWQDLSSDTMAGRPESKERSAGDRWKVTSGVSEPGGEI